MKVLCANKLPAARVRRACMITLTTFSGLLILLLPAAARAQAIDPECGNPFVTSFGPLDYRVDQGANRKIVEDYHFTPRVESLIAGQSASLGSDIDYTLRAFPNHYRALVAMMNLGARLKVAKPPGAHFTVECYFKRAVLFQPDDQVARMLYAKYLVDHDRKADATAELDYVARSSQDNGFTLYNAGLLYVELGEFDKALTMAHRAQALGFQRTELQQRLTAAGKWAEAPPPSAAASSASAAAPASAASAR